MKGVISAVGRLSARALLDWVAQIACCLSKLAVLAGTPCLLYACAKLDVFRACTKHLPRDNEAGNNSPVRPGSKTTARKDCLYMWPGLFTNVNPPKLSCFARVCDSWESCWYESTTGSLVKVSSKLLVSFASCVQSTYPATQLRCMRYYAC